MEKKDRFSYGFYTFSYELAMANCIFLHIFVLPLDFSFTMCLGASFFVCLSAQKPHILFGKNFLFCPSNFFSPLRLFFPIGIKARLFSTNMHQTTGLRTFSSVQPAQGRPAVPQPRAQIFGGRAGQAFTQDGPISEKSFVPFVNLQGGWLSSILIVEKGADAPFSFPAFCPRRKGHFFALHTPKTGG